MWDTNYSTSELDEVLALQLLVAWAGEADEERKRLGWWKTDLVDEYAGGDFFARLLPLTQKWAALEAIREAAIRTDRSVRASGAQSDRIGTLFHWGFRFDECLAERLAYHKRSGKNPNDALPVLLEISSTAKFNQEDFEYALRPPDRNVSFDVTSIGRGLRVEIPSSPSRVARVLSAALIPITDSYPAPHYFMGGSVE